jgi:ABC-type glycerol-3-phosphate transport system substrate-binding protein
MSTADAKPWGNWVAIGVVVAAFVWSCVTILLRRGAAPDSNTVVIRIAHWQLESGVKDSLTALGEKFAELPDVQRDFGHVRVVQDAIPETAYGQWITCQMIGSTAPDIVEIGNGLATAIWIEYLNRYFIPLSDIANQTNPYNAGTPLASVPLRLTFDDAMRSGYQEEMQAFMKVNLSRFTWRVFYNKTLLKKLTGTDTPPTEFRAFLKLCDVIGTKVIPGTQDHYIPIASSKYNSAAWQANIADPLTFDAIEQIDFNRDGTVGTDETFAGIQSGRIHFTDPAVAVKLQAFAKLIPYFQTGYTGLTRDEAIFPFAQSRAVFISTGTWDVGSLRDVAAGKFDVGIVGFPAITPSDREFGSLVAGPVYDPAGAGFPFGITRFSKHPAAAKRFLQYLASLKINQQLNHDIGWIPSVAGAKLPPELQKFAPVEQGIYSALNFEIGGNTSIAWAQCYSKFQSDPKYTYDDFVREFEVAYKKNGLADWQEQDRDWRRGIVNNEVFLAGLRGAALLTDVPQDDAAWVKYRAFDANRQIMTELGHRKTAQIVAEGPIRPVGPYDFMPGVLEHARKNQADGTSAAAAGSDPHVA